MTGNITSGLSEPYVQRVYMRDSISGGFRALSDKGHLFYKMRTLLPG